MTRHDYEYYEWLVAQVDIPNGKTYAGLFERIHNVEFVWTVPNDDNRIQDGLDLRLEFANERVIDLNLETATMLEILISLSRRAAFTGGGHPERWAWQFLKNLRLYKISDPLTEEKTKRINDILDTLIWRTYRPDGKGGFFPLKNPMDDQTKIELWYQMNVYVMEMNSS